MYYDYLKKEDINFMVSGSKGSALKKAVFNAGFERCIGIQGTEVVQLKE